MKNKFTNSDLAVLSACQTGVGDANLPEEAVHIAAGMLTIGFKSVVGTMWSIRDCDAPVIADALYSELHDQITSGANINVGLALHKAVDILGERVGEDDVLSWAPYVHFGI